MVQFSHSYVTTEKTIALTRRTVVYKVMSLLFNMLSKFSIAFLPRNNTLEGISSTVTEAEELINDLEDRMVEINATEGNTEKRMKRNEDSLRDLWDNIKCNNMCIIGIPEGEEREKGPEKIFKEIIS